MSKSRKNAKQVIPAALTPISIPVQELKDRFKARSVPLETDFAAIIDVADCGRKAVGLSPDFTIPATNTGLTLDSTTGQLKVLPETDKGISVTDSGVGVIADVKRGVSVDDGGISVIVNIKKGLMVDSDGIGIIDDLYIKVLCQIHNANIYGVHDNVIVVGSTNVVGGTTVYFYGRGGGVVSNHGYGQQLVLNGNAPYWMESATGGYYPQLVTATWSDIIVKDGDLMIVPFFKMNMYNRMQANVKLITL